LDPHILAATDAIASWLAPSIPQDHDFSAEQWEALKTVARVHGVGPLLFSRLEDVSWLPAGISAWLREQFLHNQARIARMHAELQEILESFAHHAIDVMPLKGSLLTALYYPDPGLRPMADLDLLIHPRDRKQSEIILADLGFRQLSANWKHQEWGRPDNLAVISTEFEHPHNPRKLDLHTSVAEMLAGPRLDITAELWGRAAPGQILGQPAWLPHPESLWLHLAVHANANIWGLAIRLVHLYDLTQVPAPPALIELDSRFVYLSLMLLDRVFPEPSRAGLLAQAARPLKPKFLAWAEEFDLCSSSFLGRDAAPNYLERLRGFYGGRPTDFLAALRFLLLPGREEVAFELGSNRGYIQAPLVWLRLFIKKLALVARLLGV
jgi:hypothetical protein